MGLVFCSYASDTQIFECIHGRKIRFFFNIYRILEFNILPKNVFYSLVVRFAGNTESIKMLENCPPTTYLLRFSDLAPGGIDIVTGILTISFYLNFLLRSFCILYRVDQSRMSIKPFSNEDLADLMDGLDNKNSSLFT